MKNILYAMNVAFFITISLLASEAPANPSIARSSSSEVERQNLKDVLSPLVKDAIALVEGRSKSNSGCALPMIGVAGGSGVGKSHFTQELVNTLRKEGVNAKILSLDDFLQVDSPPHALPLHPHFNHVQAHEILSQICAGEKQIKKPIWIHRGGPYIKSEEVMSLEHTDLLIIEGEYALHGADTYDFRKYARVGVFIDANNNDICAWNFKRGRGNKTKNTTLEEYTKKILPHLERYQRLAQEAKKSAQYLVHKDGDHQYRIIYS